MIRSSLRPHRVDVVTPGTQELASVAAALVNRQTPKAPRKRTDYSSHDIRLRAAKQSVVSSRASAVIRVAKRYGSIRFAPPAISHENRSDGLAEDGTDARDDKEAGDMLLQNERVAASRYGASVR